MALCPFGQLRVIQSTAQNWSGGVAGLSGVNYTFVIACPKPSANFRPDTLWVGSEPIPLMIRKGDHGEGNATLKTTGGSTSLEITAKVTHNQHDLYPGDNKMEEKRPPFSYRGVALLGYKQGNRQRYFVIPRITRQLISLSFP